MHLGNVDLVVVQLTLQRKKILPRALRPFEQTHEDTKVSRERRRRNSHGNGELVANTTERCDLGFLVRRLEKAHFELVGAHWQMRQDKRMPDKRYVNVRFVFARNPNEKMYPAFKEARDDIRRGLIGLLRSSYWGIRLYNNPLFKDGKEVPGRRCLSLNIGNRVEKERQEHPKDENGNKYGDPQPVQPKKFLWFPRGEVRLDPIKKAVAT